jgi:hypothetical protein
MPFSPYSLANASNGPARVLLAPVTAALPTDPYSVVSPNGVTVNGERTHAIVAAAATAGWFAAGLLKDAPSYGVSHEEGDGPEYEQTGELTGGVDSVNRALTVNFAEFTDKLLGIVENTADIETVAATVGKPAFQRVHVGTYDRLINYRAIMITAYSAQGGAIVTESDGYTRPPWLWRVIPRIAIGADDKEVEAAKDGMGFECEFAVQLEPTLSAARAHGYWLTEKAGVLT